MGRKSRIATVTLGLGLLVTSFQNCAPFKSEGALDSTNNTSSTDDDGPGTQPGVIPVVGDFKSIASNFNVNDWIVPWASPQCGPAGENGAAPDDVGAFRFLCTPSHNLYDDPIVYPGKPGAAHLHTFFGNTMANAHSTYESLRTTGDGTCDGGPVNRSAYWIPAMMNGAGKVVMPDYTTIYYKRLPKSSPTCAVKGTSCVPLPRGLRMIFGYNMNLPHDDAKQFHPKWKCDNGFAANGIAQHDTIGATECPAIARVGSGFATPDCWDGVNLDSPDHRSHLSFASYGNWGYPKCPSTHPYVIPQFTLMSWYTHLGPADLATWYLSSDRMPGKPVLPNGSTYHSDWFGAWDDDIMDVWTSNAIDKLMNCSAGMMGDGRALKRPPGFKWSADPRLVDPPILSLEKAHTHH